MRPSQVVPLLAQCFTAGEQVLLVGPPGCGKTDMERQAAVTVKFRNMIKHPAVEEPPDIRGLPFATQGADGKPMASFLPFDDLHALINATEPTVLFLDDFGQATEAMQKAYMQLLLGKKLNGHKLPDCVVICAATNGVGQRAGVTGLLEPVKSRFTTIVEVEVSVDDWCLWALDHGMPPILIAFVQDPSSTLPDGKHFLNSWEFTKEIRNSGCPRTAANLGRLWNLGIRDQEVLAGAVGKGNAAQFAVYAEAAASMPSVHDILTAPDTIPLPDKPSHCYLASVAVGRGCESANFDQAMTFFNRMPQPYRVLGIREAKKLDTKRAERKDPLVQHTTAYQRWVVTEGKDVELGLGAIG